MGRGAVILSASPYRIVLSTSFLAWGMCFVVLYVGSFALNTDAGSILERR